MAHKFGIALLASSLALTACADGSGQGGINKTTGGTLAGAAAGGLLGAQVGRGGGQLAAVAAGTLLGAFIGHEVGRSLDRADQLAAERATVDAHRAPVGQTIRWDNPENGHYGTVTPTREGRDTRSNQYCREYQTTVVVGGREERAFGTACQQPDGSWKILN
ncbi:MAG: glycine zipper 2TM domain-containing protein [Alphaproteobacteria bacterium]|nr:glycine zipper 2TM domain-containing protein [Alphaproteobacteria bacterium]